MPTIITIGTLPRKVRAGITYFSGLVAALIPLFGLTTTAANACACGCSVFDVGGGLLPQEDDHGGRFFLEYWYSNQTQNYIGSSKAPGNLNVDKNLNTGWYNMGLSYNFNRDWGMFVRFPNATRSLTTDTGLPPHSDIPQQ